MVEYVEEDAVALKGAYPKGRNLEKVKEEWNIRNTLN